jgi:hypothetical protein
MKIQAILFMKNDFMRARSTLKNFCKYNPEIPVRVINAGGQSPKPYLLDIPNLCFLDTEDLWQNMMRSPGSFGPRFFDYFFDYGLNIEFSHTLYLETDVLTNRKITISPKYDISGPNNPCSSQEFILYEYLGIDKNLKHTGCGGTIFSFNYFKTIKNGYYYLYQDLFDKYPENYVGDLVSTLVGRKAGLSVGSWEEVSNFPFQFINDKRTLVDMNATLVHNIK